jgi:hypothetical protein
MTPLAALAIVAGVSVAASIWETVRRRRRDREASERLRAEWGCPRTGTSRGGAPGFYHSRLPAAASMDAATWSDLNMEAVFRFFDRTASVLGSEVLYDRLRRLDHDAADLMSFDRTADRFRQDERARLALQVELRRITETDPGIAWQIPLESLPPLPAWVRWACPALAVTVIAACLAAAVNPALIGLAVPILLLSFIARGVIGPRIMPWVTPFLSVGQILDVAKRVARVEPASEPTTATLVRLLPGLTPLSRIARWLGRDPSRSDLLALVSEYLNLVFCADGNALLRGFSLVHRRQQELREVAEALGRLDAAIAVASVRGGTADWCRPTVVDPFRPARFVALRHPLVEHCVPNSLTLGPPGGVVLTGANMTGKSTFLRSLGTNAVLAQSVFTVFAGSYEAPWLSVRSCISPTDELLEGKSLYQKEAETVVAILERAKRPGVLLCLFDELFRGTNSVDRVCATAALCSHLLRAPAGEPAEGRSRCLVVVATHDLELVPLLAPGYAPFHFGDRIEANRLAFDYRLRPGIATSRNAIALLQILGAPAEVVADAHHRASVMR